VSDYLGPCHFCGRDVTTLNTPAYPICGWEGFRGEQGGANRIIARTRIPGFVAHVECAERHAHERSRGIVRGQLSFVDV